MIISAFDLVLTADDANAPVFGIDNKLTTANLTGTSADASYPLSNLANPSTNLRWKASSAVAQTLTIDNTSLQDDNDYVGIARHNFGSGLCTVRLDLVLPDNSTVTVIPAFQPATDDALILRFTTRHVKKFVLIITPTGSTIPQAAVIYAGKLVVSQRRLYVGHVPVLLGAQVVSVTGKSEAGDFLGRIITQEMLATAVALKNLTASYVRSVFKPFTDKAKDTPFFFAWRPGTYPLETAYCWLTADAKYVNQLANGMMSVDLSLMGVSK